MFGERANGCHVCNSEVCRPLLAHGSTGPPASAACISPWCPNPRDPLPSTASTIVWGEVMRGQGGMKTALMLAKARDRNAGGGRCNRERCDVDSGQSFRAWDDLRRSARIAAFVVALLVPLAFEFSSSAWGQSAQLASVPATSASKDELERQKLKAEIKELEDRNSVKWAPLAEPVGSLASAVTAFLAVFGIVVGGWRWRAEFQASKERRDDERFASVLQDLGHEREPMRAGAALMLRRFFDKPHSRIYQQAFDATVSALRQYGPETERETSTTLSHALITAFVEGVPIHRARVARTVPELHHEALGANLELGKETKDRRVGLQRRYLNASDIRLAGAFLWKADLQGVFMPRARLWEADLSEASLQSAVLWGSGTDLYAAKLYDANLDGANLGSANLEKAKLVRAHLRGAVLNGTQLSEASLDYANLTDATLRTAFLPDAELKGALLIRADLTKADLQRADLRDADLRGADLTGAQLDGAKLERVRYNSKVCEGDDGKPIEPTRWPDGKPPPLALDVSREARGRMAQPA